MKEKTITVRVSLSPSEQAQLAQLEEMGCKNGILPAIFHAYLFRVGMTAQLEAVETYSRQSEREGQS